MIEKPAPPITTDWYDGPRTGIRELFELADDSPTELDNYIELGRVLVARTPAGEIVGHLQLVPTAEPAQLEIKNIAVRAQYRRRGVGRQLLEHAVSACRSEQVRTLTLTAALADIDVLGFYQRCGFRASSIKPDAFTPEKGYPAGLEIDGVPIRDAIRFTRDLRETDAV